MLEIVTFVLGPVSTNCYLIADSESGDAAVIDPAWDGQLILEEASTRGWMIKQLWFTHAHFDHIGGTGEIARGLKKKPVVALHTLELDLWRNRGGAQLFGIGIDPGPEPTFALAHGMFLELGSMIFEVRHTPGHTPGHCIFTCLKANVLFSGDLIFQGSVGRTDLPGGDWEALVNSIRTQIYILPDETRILPGHGPDTTVREEKENNPFVQA